MSIKNFFSHEKTTRHESDDYKVNFSRRSMIIVAVISLLLALIVWGLAVYSDSTSYNYTSVPIEIRNATALTDAGYKVILATENVSFRVTGRARVVKLLTDDSVRAYVDLSDINTDESRVVVKLKFESEYNLFYSNISAEDIPVMIIDSFDETK